MESRALPARTRLSDREWTRRLEALADLQQPCRLCPRGCSALRSSGEKGQCGGGIEAHVPWWGSHPGEEPPLSGTAGAGNVFFAGCSVGCVFCQNHQISRPERVDPRWRKTVDELAGIYLSLQARGCHNLNWVTPGHVLPAAVEALFEADRRGLRLPLVYNSSGYERTDSLDLLFGIVDVYLPDYKYGPRAEASLLCAVEDYAEVAGRAIEQMWRQVGPLKLDADGVAIKGLIVRHLVLPADVADTAGVLSFLASRLGPEVSVSLMAQYVPPAEKLGTVLDRPLTADEYEQALGLLDRFGLQNGYVQELDASKCLAPDFERDDPFRVAAAPLDDRDS